MASGFTPDLALDYLAELSTDIRAGVVLGNDGELLAGEEEVAASARDLLAATTAAEIEVQTERGAVFAIRDDRVSIIVVARRSALSSLVMHDLRMALNDLDATLPA
jgi:hypothetical protein